MVPSRVCRAACFSAHRALLLLHRLLACGLAHAGDLLFLEMYKAGCLCATCAPLSLHCLQCFWPVAAPAPSLRLAGSSAAAADATPAATQ